MTLEDLERMNVEFLDIPTVSKYLNKDTRYIRDALRRGVPWGYYLGSSDYRIPKRAFISYHKNGYLDISQKERTNSRIDFDELSSRLTEFSRQMRALIELIDQAGKIIK